MVPTPDLRVGSSNLSGRASNSVTCDAPTSATLVAATALASLVEDVCNLLACLLELLRHRSQSMRTAETPLGRARLASDCSADGLGGFDDGTVTGATFPGPTGLFGVEALLDEPQRRA